MGHSTHKRYNIKLNNHATSYDSVVEAIENYLNECNLMEANSKDKGESYSASVSRYKGELVVSFYGYKSRSPLELSDKVLRLIETNINTSPTHYFYYLEEKNTFNDCWEINCTFGKAAIILSRLTINSNISSSDKGLFDKFNYDLYEDRLTHITLNTVSDVVRCIENYERRASMINYFTHKKFHRCLIPFLRNNSDGSVLLAGVRWGGTDLSVYQMTKDKKISRIEFKDGETFKSFISANIREISANISTPKMISVVTTLKEGYFVDNLKIFNDEGPFVKVKNNIM